jgi:glycosyltransferase involved in cell wall biosynthesis
MNPAADSARRAIKRSVVFLALGRRGAIPRLALQLAQAAAQRQNLNAIFVVSSSSELLAKFSFLGERLVTLDTIKAHAPATILRNYFRAERRILQIAADRPHAVINLCPHVWSPLLVPRIRNLGVPFVTIIHDAMGHPGDTGALLVPWFRSEARAADVVVTLSRSVANALTARCGIAPERIVPLFLPDLVYDAPVRETTATLSSPLRLLHFGRLLAYKGLDLLLDALDIAARQGTRFTLTIAGAGRIGRRARRRLAALDAEVMNRWFGDTEIGPLFSRHDALVISHRECSQSGTVAAAFGSGVPVVAVPTGGLVEQVVDGKTGVLASASTAEALAGAIRRVAAEPGLHAAIRENLETFTPERSTERFLDVLLAVKPWSFSALATKVA